MNLDQFPVFSQASISDEQDRSPASRLFHNQGCTQQTSWCRDPCQSRLLSKPKETLTDWPANTSPKNLTNQKWFLGKRYIKNTKVGSTCASSMMDHKQNFANIPVSVTMISWGLKNSETRGQKKLWLILSSFSWGTGARNLGTTSFDAATWYGSKRSVSFGINSFMPIPGNAAYWTLVWSEWSWELSC